MNQETKKCQNCKKDFTIEPDDFGFYEKIKVPPPTFCPECRLIRRLSFRNERALYKRKCDLCGKDEILMFFSESPFKTYCFSCWWSDDWDPTKYGKDYDFEKPFFEQFKELLLVVPRPGNIKQGNNINSQYTNRVSDMKNCYLAFGCNIAEDCMYGSWMNDDKECIDCLHVLKSERCYECIDCTSCYDLSFSQESRTCSSSAYLFNCRNCESCFGCVNLRNRSYCIWNKQYSRDQFLLKMKNFNLGSYKFVKTKLDEFSNFALKFPRKYARIINCVNSSGEDLRDCKNSFFIFNAYDIENIKFGYRCAHAKDSMDVCHIETELAYEHATGGSGHSFNIKFIATGLTSLNEVEYVDSCQSSSNLFGCIGLKSKQYCILNKQYIKEEYFKLIGKIKKHMMDMPYLDKKGNVYKYGEFFPFEFSPFGYNETIIDDLFPLSKEKITERGYNWKEKIENKYIVTKKTEELPDDIKKVDDSILNEVIECAITKKTFKITPFELQFYHRMNIPIPRIHQDERYKKRLAMKNPIILYHRECMCDKENHFHGKGECMVEFETSYAPDRPEIVYCEKCYQQEVY